VRASNSSFALGSMKKREEEGKKQEQQGICQGRKRGERKNLLRLDINHQSLKKGPNEVRGASKKKATGAKPKKERRTKGSGQAQKAGKKPAGDITSPAPPTQAPLTPRPGVGVRLKTLLCQQVRWSRAVWSLGWWCKGKLEPHHRGGGG